MVEKGEVGAAHRIQRKIGGLMPPAVGLMENADARIFRSIGGKDFRGAVGTAIVHAQKLPVRIRLHAYGGQHLLQKGFGIVDGENN